MQFEDTRNEYEHAFFLSHFKYGAVVKPESWGDPGSQHGSLIDESLYMLRTRIGGFGFCN